MRGPRRSDARPTAQRCAAHGAAMRGPRRSDARPMAGERAAARGGAPAGA